MVETKSKAISPATSKIPAPVRENALDAETSTSSVVAVGTIIEGNFSTSDSIRVDGQVIGDIHCKKRLVIGETGKVKGVVNAKDAIVRGAVEGQLVVHNTLHLYGTASVNGTIESLKMIVEEGALFNGSSNTGNDEK